MQYYTRFIKVTTTTIFFILIKFSLSQTSSNNHPEYASSCSNGELQIKIPYANEKTSNLLNYSVGGCSGNGPLGTHHNYHYNSTTNQAILSIAIEPCNIKTDENLDSPNTINVTIGISDLDKNTGQNRDLVFYNALLGAECQEIDFYTVNFEYARDVKFGVDSGECEVDENGSCIIPAYERYNFGFKEFTDASYEVEVVDGSETSSIANELIYLKIFSEDLPSSKKFAVRNCKVVDGLALGEKV